MLWNYSIFSKSSKPNKKLPLLFPSNPILTRLPQASFLTLSLFFWFYFFTQSTSIPPFWPDEVLFFSPAQAFAKTGHLTTNVLEGLIPGMEYKTLWMPPGFLILSSLFLKILPDTIFIFRFFSALTVFLSAWLFYKLLVQEKFSKFTAMIGFATVLSEPLVFRFGTSGRMEGLTALFFLASIYVAGSKREHILKSFLAGILLSCSAMTHPFGASFGLVSLFFLVRDRISILQKVFFFILGGIIPICLWAVYIHPDWNLLTIQFGAQLIRKQILFGSFTALTKLKVFLFGFAFSKLRLIIIITQIFTLVLVSISLYKKKHELNSRLNVYWIWILSVAVALYSSSEGWYVFHFIFPFAWGMALLAEQKYFGRILSLAGISLSFAGWLHIVNIHWIQTDSTYILNTQFQKLETILKPHNKVYLQTIPDPYFHLSEKYPEKKFLEFIPGELEFPSNEYTRTIESQDAFVFYDDSLKNQAISLFLSNHPEWIREEWEIPVPSNHWLHFKTIVYHKPTGNENASP